MSWQSILKIVPTSGAMMPFVFTNKRQTEIFMESVKNFTKPNKKLEGVMDNIAGGKTSIEKIITDSNMLGTAHADLEMNEIKENYKTFVTLYWQVVRDLGSDDSGNMTNNERLSELKKLVEEGNTARLAGDLVKVRSILSQIDDRKMVSGRNQQKDKSVAIKLKILRLSIDKPYMSFENLGSKKQFLPKLAELLGGELKDDVIFVDFKKQSDFQRAMTPETDEDGAFTETPAILEKKKKIRQFYEDNLRGNKWFLNVEGKKEEMNIKLKEFDEFIGSNAKLSLYEDFTSSHVFKYMTAIEKKVGKSVNIWKPVKFPNGQSVISTLFLKKSSPNSFNLSPYAKLLLEGGNFGEAWFTKLFKSIRETSVLSQERAQSFIIQNIVDAITKNNGVSANNIVDKEIIESISSLIKNYASKNESTVKAEVKELYTSGGPLAKTLNKKTSDYRASQLHYLEDNFTVKEALAFQDWWKENDYPAEELKIEYMKDDSPTRETNWVLEADKKENYPKEEWKNNPHLSSIKIEGSDEYKPKFIPKLDAKGEKISRTEDFISSASYAIVTAFDERVSPKEAYSGEEGGYEGFNVSSGKARPATDKATAKKITTLKEKIKETKAKAASKHEQEAVKNKLDKLEANLKEAEASLLNRTRKDIGDATSRLRHNLFNMSDFGSYILDLAIKLKEEGGLSQLIKTSNTGASALEKYDAERGVVFFAQMAQRTNADELGEAFKVIDEDPESDKAMQTAKALNTKMLTILPIMTTQIVGAFESRLQDFVDKPAQFPELQVLPAKRALLEAKLIKEGE